jgi:hypothetical protein
MLVHMLLIVSQTLAFEDFRLMYRQTMSRVLREIYHCKLTCHETALSL